jgi:hypothetical protein
MTGIKRSIDSVHGLEERLAALEGAIVRFTSGEGNPSDENVVVGSEYTNTATGDKWIKTVNGWKKLAVLM